MKSNLWQVILFDMNSVVWGYLIDYDYEKKEVQDAVWNATAVPWAPLDLHFAIGTDVWALLHVAAEEDTTAQVRMAAHLFATVFLLAILGTANEPTATIAPRLETWAITSVYHDTTPFIISDALRVVLIAFWFTTTAFRAIFLIGPCGSSRARLSQRQGVHFVITNP